MQEGRDSEQVRQDQADRGTLQTNVLGTGAETSPRKGESGCPESRAQGGFGAPLGRAWSLAGSPEKGVEGPGGALEHGGSERASGEAPWVRSGAGQPQEGAWGSPGVEGRPQEGEEAVRGLELRRPGGAGPGWGVTGPAEGPGTGAGGLAPRLPRTKRLPAQLPLLQQPEPREQRAGGSGAPGPRCSPGCGARAARGRRRGGGLPAGRVAAAGAGA